VEHYQLEQKLSEQLGPFHGKNDEWGDLSQKSGNTLAMMIPTNPMNNKNSQNDFLSSSMVMIRQLTEIPGFVEILALVLIWILVLLPKPLFE